MKCEECECVRACKWKFGGGTWWFKSHDGVGCNNPLPQTDEYQRAVEADIEERRLRELEQMEKEKGEWTPAEDVFPCPPNTWSVLHRGREYKTTAISEQDAVNKIRYRLYGKTPEAELDEFSAMPKRFEKVHFWRLVIKEEDL